jgi:ABC-type transport system involved in multi-copper enzyme maturation permease subunit
MNNMFTILTIAKKEYTDALKNKVFLTFLLFLVGLIVISVYIGSLDFQSKVSVYQKAYEQLMQSGQSADNLTKPEFYPLQLLRGSIEYLEIIGAVLAIALGYLSIASRISFFLGKMIGNALLLLSVSIIVFICIYIIVRLIGGVQLTSLETVKLLSSFFYSWIYLCIFFSLSATLALLLRSLPNALILAFVTWILFVLIVPQIGDTMDTDNQVPGGFFNAIHVDKSQSKIILQQFTFYETARNALEEASITKHYERLTFAILGIKDIYNNKSLSFILQDKWNEIIWLLSYFILLGISSIIVFATKKTIWREEL